MKCISFIDQNLKNFAETLGITLKSRDFDVCEIETAKESNRYQILYTQTSKNKTTRIVLKNFETEEVALLVKGKKRVLEKLFNEDDISALDDVMNYATASKHKSKIVFGYKILTKLELKALKFDMKNANLSPINIEGRVEAVFKNFEKDLVYSGMIFTDSPVVNGVAETVKSLTDAGIKI